MNPKMLWASALMRFGLVPIVLASVGATIGLVALVAILYNGLVVVSGNERAVNLSMVLVFFEAVLLLGFSSLFNGFRRGLKAMAILHTSIFVVMAAIVWGGMLVMYIQNGFAASQKVPSPWPLVEFHRGGWWAFKLTVGLVSALVVSVWFSLMIWRGSKRVWQEVSMEVKKADAKIRQKAQENVERQQLRNKYADLSQTKCESEAL